MKGIALLHESISSLTEESLLRLEKQKQAEENTGESLCQVVDVMALMGIKPPPDYTF